MNKEVSLKEKWDKIVDFMKSRFGDGEALDVDAIIYLIGIQELGIGNQNFKKDDKINLMHIAICKLLEPYGYYKFDYVDADGWPHYELIEQLPNLKAGEQSVFMKEAIVNYFENQELI